MISFCQKSEIDVHLHLRTFTITSDRRFSKYDLPIDRFAYVRISHLIAKAKEGDVNIICHTYHLKMAKSESGLAMAGPDGLSD